MWSPILKGKAKNNIIPAVMLLNKDHCAKAATPTTVNIDDINRKSWSFFTPQIITIVIRANNPIRKFTYLITKFVLCSKAWCVFAYFLIPLAKK